MGSSQFKKILCLFLVLSSQVDYDTVRIIGIVSNLTPQFISFKFKYLKQTKDRAGARTEKISGNIED